MAVVALVVRRTIRATAARLFAAWTEPNQLVAWWGPRPVTCAGAEVDLRAGGTYRILNVMPDGAILAIEGEFRAVEPPHKLVYTWHMGGAHEERSLVTVRFEARDSATEVIVVHEQIPNEAARESHGAGWLGCLDSLARAMGE
jgi:uncharacterized protein YndB with AHSA1/START domain